MAHNETYSDPDVTLNVIAEQAAAVRCPNCRTKYILGRHRDRLKCFTCNAMLMVQGGVEEYQ